MGDWTASFIFGAILAAGGAAGIVWHVRAWRGHRCDERLGSDEIRYYRRQFFRRIQATGLIFVIGVLLPVGAAPMSMTASAFVWIVILALALWVLMLGFGDLLSTRVHTRDALTRLRAIKQEQQNLEREVERLRAQQSTQRKQDL